MANVLVQTIIRGQENIDRMKREIDMVVKAVVGLIPLALKERSDMFPQDNTYFSFCNRGCEWVILFRNGGFEVTCTILVGGGSYALQKGASYFPELRKIQDIHEALGVLLTGFMQFKAMQKHLAPFLDAADYEF